MSHKSRLTEDEAIEVWLLRWEGLYQSEIANKLNTNGGRVSNILTEKKHYGTRSKAAEKLGLSLDAWPPNQKRRPYNAAPLFEMDSSPETDGTQSPS